MDVIQYLTAAKTALEVIKGAATLLPKSSKSEEVREQIERAEKALKTSEGAAAKALGYKICQCTFPPQIMLWKEAERAMSVRTQLVAGRLANLVQLLGCRVEAAGWVE